MLLQHQHPFAQARQHAGTAESGHASTDDNGIQLFRNLVCLPPFMGYTTLVLCEEKRRVERDLRTQ